MTRGRAAGLLVALVAAGVLAAALLRPAADADDAIGPRRADTTVSVLGRSLGARIAPGFVGVSIEYPVLTQYTGSDPRHVNPVLENLLRALAPGQRPVIRIGGDSTDTTWWPTGGLTRPGGVSYSLTPLWLSIVGKLAADVNGRLILGVDLAAQPLAVGRAEARALAAGLPGRSLMALELSNEASRYAIFPWYHDAAGRPVFARSRSYDFQAFSGEFGRLAAGVPHSVRVAGPTLAGDGWMAHLGWFLARQRRVDLVTFHRYPLNRCFTPVGSPQYPTLAHLLGPAASDGLARAVASSVAVARRRGRPVRLDELNSVACGGKNGVSNTFAAALWALDTSFGLVRAGVTGVNFHTFPRASYALFHFRRRGGRWSGAVAPEYYGLAMFALAAPPGSQLLATRDSRQPAVRAWATRTPDGTLRITLLNDDLARRHVVLVRVAGAGGASASVLALTAPRVGSTSGIRLGGGGFDPSGAITREHQTVLARSAGGYLIRLPRASAVLLTIRPRG